LSLSDGATVVVGTGFLEADEKLKKGTGKGGQLTVIAKDAVYISGANSGFSSNVFNHGQGGTILITTPTLVVTEGGSIEAVTRDDGNAGEINMEENAEIVGSTPGSGNVGDIFIEADTFSLSNSAGVAVNAGSSKTNEGTAWGTVIQTTDFLDVSGLLNTPCNQRIAERLSHFAMIHSYGELNAFNDLLPSGLMSLEPITLKTPIARKPGKKGRSSLLMGRLTACSPLRLSMSTRVKIPTPSGHNFIEICRNI